MYKKIFFPLLTLFLFACSWTLADDSILEVDLKPISKDTPIFTRSQEAENGVKYSLKMIKVSNEPKIKTPPATDAVVLYYGQVKLGFPANEYGVLIDFEGKDRQIWVDPKADGNFAAAPPVQIFKSDRYSAGNVFYAPTPISFQIGYTLGDHDYQVPVQFDLNYLFISRTSRDDVFYLINRTWFYGEITLDGEEIYFGLVDTHDNGTYNDPNDLIFVGRDSDLNFTAKTGQRVKSFTSLKSKTKVHYKINYSYCPEKLILTKDEH